MDFVIGLGVIVTGLFIVYSKVAGLFNSATKTLDKANTETNEQNKVVLENTKEIKLLQLREDEVIKKVQLANEIHSQKIDEFARKNEEKQAELIATLENMIEQLKPLLQLPKAFTQTVINNPESVKSGVARKVCDILGVNTDNVEKTIEQKQDNKVGE